MKMFCEFELIEVTTTDGVKLNRFFFFDSGTFDVAAGKWKFPNSADANNYETLKQLTGIAEKLRIVENSGNKINSDFLKSRRKTEEKIYGNLLIFILKSMNELLYIVPPSVSNDKKSAAGAVVKTGVSLNRCYEFATDVADKMFPLYKTIVDMQFPSGVSQSIVSLDKEKFVSNARNKFALVGK